MFDKPIVLLEGWQVLSLHGRPHLLLGFATDHPRLAGYRRHIRTSRVLYLSGDLSTAETLNTRYELRYGITDMGFEGPYPVRIDIADLVARSDLPGGEWRIFRGDKHLADIVPDYKVAILRMLAFLDEPELISG
jgi:hypothetical protein